MNHMKAKEVVFLDYLGTPATDPEPTSIWATRDHRNVIVRGLPHKAAGLTAGMKIGQPVHCVYKGRIPEATAKFLASYTDPKAVAEHLCPSFVQRQLANKAEKMMDKLLVQAQRVHNSIPALPRVEINIIREELPPPLPVREERS